MITQNMQIIHKAFAFTPISPFIKYLIDQIYYGLFIRIAQVQCGFEKCNYNIKSL